MSGIKTERILYLDNLKIFLTMLVIVHHVGQAYGPTGGFWHYTSPEKIGWLGNFFLLNASYFMGLFFFISGFFFPGAYDRKGGTLFIRDKLIRFGVPLLFAFLLMIPAELYLYHRLQGNGLSFFEYYLGCYFGTGTKPAYSPFSLPEYNFGHLWYVEHLLIYSFLYLGFRRIVDKLELKKIVISWPHIAALILLLGIITWVIRVPLGYPIDRWTGFLGFIQMEPAHIAQYSIFFIAGILACRNSWLDALTLKVGWIFIAIAATVVISYWPTRYVFGSSVFEYWEFKEGLLAVSISIGLLSLFKFYFNRESALSKALARSSYAAYILHVPFAIAFQVVFHYLSLNVLVKFMTVSFLTIAVTYLAAYLIRKNSIVRRVI